MPIRKIEIEFAIPVELTDEEHHHLNFLANHICKRSCPEGWAFWPAGQGSKPTFSQADAAFLGKTVDPSAPLTGEPAWDDSVYHIDCHARELFPIEIERNKARAERAAECAARWDSRLAGWLHKRGFVGTSWIVADLSIWYRRKRRGRV